MFICSQETFLWRVLFFCEYILLCFFFLRLCLYANPLLIIYYLVIWVIMDRVAFQASYSSQLEGFLLSYHKDKCLLQTWLSCIILYGAHLPYFQVVSQDQGLLPLPNSLSFLQKEKTLCLGVFLTSRNNIFWWCFLRTATAGFSLLSFHPFLPHSSYIYKYFGTFPSFTQRICRVSKQVKNSEWVKAEECW